MGLLGSPLTVVAAAVFESEDASGVALGERVFEDCAFRACRFVGTSFDATRLSGCVLEDCDLSGAALAGASLHETRLLRRRPRGVDVAAARSLRGVVFLDCVLDDTSWIDADVPGLVLRGGSAVRACFQGARLRGADLRRLDLTDALFGGTDLREADLREARGYALDPGANRVAGMRVTWPDAAALLGALGVRLEDGADGPRGGA